MLFETEMPVVAVAVLVFELLIVFPPELVKLNWAWLVRKLAPFGAAWLCPESVTVAVCV